MKLLTAGIGVALSMNARNAITKTQKNRKSVKKNERNVSRNKAKWQKRTDTTSTGAPPCLTAAAFTATIPSTRPTPSSTLSISRTSARLKRRQSAGRYQVRERNILSSSGPGPRELRRTKDIKDLDES